MKFYAKNVDFFSEITEDLKAISSSVYVGHLNSLDELKTVSPSRWIVVEDSLEPRDLVSQVYHNNIPHFVQKNPGKFCLDLKRTAQMLENPEAYFNSQQLLIASQPISSTYIQFSSPDDKNSLLEKATQFLAGISGSGTDEAAFAILEELYMNSIIDAPKEAKRKGITPQNKPCEIFLAYSNETLQISCTDACGSLDLRKLFARLFEVYDKGAGEAINLTQPGGAGIGCFLLFENCQTLIFGVQPGKMTKVTCLIPLGMSMRARNKLKKSIHGFEVNI